MLQVFYANSADFQEKATIEQLLKKLPKEVAIRAKRYKFEQDAYNFVIGRLLLKKGIQALGYPLRIKNISYNEFGQPNLNGMSFSISHTQHLVACAFSDEMAVGLDIELPRPINRKHFRHCFSDLEWAEISKDDTLQTFYSYWTQKEAVLKANGVGLDQLMAISIGEGGEFAHFELENDYISGWTLINFKIDAAFGCLCTSTMEKPFVQLEKIELGDIFLSE